VKGLGAAASSANAYYSTYGLLALMLVLSLAGLPCLHAIRKREQQIQPEPSVNDPPKLLSR